MRLFRFNDNWLRHKVKSQMKNDHPELFLPFWKSIINNLKNYLFSKRGWVLILIGVIATFLAGGVVKIPYINVFDISLDTADILVDQRTANIAIITSITLVVVGFLINNLAVKEAFSYQLLFKHSYLYPIIYLTLSTIGCFFIISTLRDELSSDVFIKMVIIGTYITLLILFLIGFLFRTIVQFTNNQTIRKLLHKELIIESKERLKNILYIKYSRDELDAFMKGNEIKQYDRSEEFITALGESESSENKNTVEIVEKRIHNINLKKINNFLRKKNSEDLFYVSLTLEQTTNRYNNFVFSKEKENSSEEKKELQSYLVLSNPEIKERDELSVRKYFDNKFEHMVSKSEHKDLEPLLESYIELYKLQMKHQK